MDGSFFSLMSPCLSRHSFVRCGTLLILNLQKRFVIIFPPPDRPQQNPSVEVLQLYKNRLTETVRFFCSPARINFLSMPLLCFSRGVESSVPLHCSCSELIKSLFYSCFSTKTQLATGKAMSRPSSTNSAL